MVISSSPSYFPLVNDLLVSAKVTARLATKSSFRLAEPVSRRIAPAKVDFVMIFTHDVNFYDYISPVPVHTDSSGLSDWTAIVLLDNTQSSAKYIREYVWIFRFKRASFEPGHFSRGAKPDHSEIESGPHASDRAIDAAFKFVACQKE